MERNWKEGLGTASTGEANSGARGRKVGNAETLEARETGRWWVN